MIYLSITDEFCVARVQSGSSLLLLVGLGVPLEHVLEVVEALGRADCGLGEAPARAVDEVAFPEVGLAKGEAEQSVREKKDLWRTDQAMRYSL